MPKITVTMDGKVHSELELTKERTTLGRRPYNDVVIENLTVSGEHAALLLVNGQVTVEDLHSTNGTYIDGKAIKSQVLRHGDVMEMGKYKVKFESPAPEDAFEKTMMFKPRSASAAPLPPAPPVQLRGAIKVMSGPAAGREMVLTKVVTTVGKPGVSVAAITQRRHQFFVHHVEGQERIAVNDTPVGEEPLLLHNGDRISLAGTDMQFVQA